MRVLDTRKVTREVEVQLHLAATRAEWNILLGCLAACDRYGWDGRPLDSETREKITTMWKAIEKGVVG